MMKNMIWMKRLIGLLCVLLSACDAVDPPTVYGCKFKGEIFRYQEGVRQGSTDEQAIEFFVKTFDWRRRVEVGPHPLIPEISRAELLLDTKNTNAVERYYYQETTSQSGGEKMVTSLVLNTLSGDARVFHHRWIPPVEWKNSDQYTLTGHCRKNG